MAKNEELGLEVINLANAKLVLTKERDACLMELEKCGAKSSAMTRMNSMVASLSGDDVSSKGFWHFSFFFFIFFKQNNSFQTQGDVQGFKDRIDKMEKQMRMRQAELGRRNSTLENQNVIF